MASLTDEQKKALAQHLSDGASIADIQRVVNDEFKLGMTYMEVRFLIDDLNLEIPEPEAPAEEDSSEEISPEPVEGVQVEVDKIKRPGAAMSGEVTFSDGQKAVWYIDQHGRLGLDPSTEGYQPSEEDIQEFQVKLRDALQGPQI